jgi:glycosyltransferase involved in cell wall biosynthesis
MIALSVIICAHNPRVDYLRRTLAALQAQTLPRSQWELLLVDNASSVPLAQSFDLSWHPQGRHLCESTLGLTPARLRGIAEARGQWFVFVDDDNELAADYLAKVISISAQNPRVAVFGAGNLRPELEIPAAPELKGLLPMLALREVAVARVSSHPKQGDCLPCGAGLCVRRETAGKFVHLVEQLNAVAVLGRKGAELFSHEDDLFSWAAAGAGFQFGVFPELQITHLIGASRLNQPYFLRLIYYHAFSQWVLHYLLAGDRPKPNSPGRLLRLIPHALRRGLFSARCHWHRARGEGRAARFIAENQLRPLPPLSFPAAENLPVGSAPAAVPSRIQPEQVA